MTRSGGRRAAVTSAVMPGALAASVTATSLRSPWAVGERTTRAHSWPGPLMSSPSGPRPRSSRGSSLRGSRAPIELTWRPAARGGPARWPRPPRRGPDSRRSGTGWRRRARGLVLASDSLPALLTEAGLDEHEEAGGAEPALQRVLVADSRLQVRQL